MKDEVLTTIRENHMFNKGDKVVLGVSGGPDSICLLHMLHEMRKDLGITLVAAHINHGLRGLDADEDERYVEDFCKNLGVEVYSTKVDLHQISKDRNLSCESAGREVRYEFFRNVLGKTNAQKIALAHNANDVAETMLMRMMRGTGLEGLVGIKPVRDNIYVRPLINAKRDEIEKYCIDNNLRPRIDKTNLENIYTRNKVRLELIPYIRENFNEDIISVLNRLSDIVAKDNDFIQRQAEEKLRMYCEQYEQKVIILSEAFTLHEALLARIIRRALQMVSGNLNNFEKNHIYQVMDLHNKQNGKMIQLPNGIAAVNDYGKIEIHRVEEKEKGIDKKKDSYDLHMGVNHIEDMNLLVHMRVLEKEENMNFKASDDVKYFDFDKFNGSVILRFRKNGDKFAPLGMKGSKKLKDIFIDMKIPTHMRDDVPLICVDEQIAWIVGIRVSERFKIERKTKKIIEIKIEREEM